jgi:hypothetical protein
MITQEHLKNILHYNISTGVFTWKSCSKYKPYKLNNSAGGYSSQGYIDICIDAKKYKAHRLAWLYVYGELPKNQIDHINGIRDDNRLCNLRECTQSQNNKNTSLSKRNKHGIKGVSFNQGKFKATCTVDKKTFHLGYFNSALDAKTAYNDFAKLKFGEFYRSI